MKKILVTGSLGYLGSVVTNYLNKNGFSCVGYDTGFFKDCTLYPPPPVETVMKDSRDINEKDLEGVHAVVHLSGISNDPFGDLDGTNIYDITRAYTKAVAELCKKKGVRFIFASSCSVYGIGGENVMDEDSPTTPQTAYSLNKLHTEADLRAMADGSFAPIAFRFATVFGLSPRIRLDIVVNMFSAMAASTGTIVLNSDGSAWRPNVHVLDVCQAVKAAIDSEWNKGLLILNVGDEQNNVRIIDIAKLARKNVPGSTIKFLSEDKGLDKEGLIRDRNVNAVDTRTYRVSFERIRKIFPGFRCAWSIEDGVKEMVAKFREIKFSDADFKNINFYRLKKMEYLYTNRYISADRRWLRSL